MKRHTQSFWRRFFASRWFWLSAFAVALLFALGYARAYYQDYKVRQEIKALQAEVKQLESKKIESLEILKYVISPAFVEEKARTELNMKKPGENVIIVKNQAEFEKQDEGLSTDAVLLPNPVKWWYYFTHKQININH